VEIASPASSEAGKSWTVEKMLKMEKVWGTDIIPRHQEESVKFKVPDGCFVTGFEIASRRFRSDSQMRIEEVKMDGTIGAELYGWNVCGTLSGDWKLPGDYAALSITVTTMATQFKVSVRHTDCSKTHRAGVAIFRAQGVIGAHSELMGCYEKNPDLSPLRGMSVYTLRGTDCHLHFDRGDRWRFSSSRKQAKDGNAGPIKSTTKGSPSPLKLGLKWQVHKKDIWSPDWQMFPQLKVTDVTRRSTDRKVYKRAVWGGLAAACVALAAIFWMRYVAPHVWPHV